MFVQPPLSPQMLPDAYAVMVPLISGGRRTSDPAAEASPQHIPHPTSAAAPMSVVFIFGPPTSGVLLRQGKKGEHHFHGRLPLFEGVRPKSFEVRVGLKPQGLRTRQERNKFGLTVDASLDEHRFEIAA